MFRVYFGNVSATGATVREGTAVGSIAIVATARSASLKGGASLNVVVVQALTAVAVRVVGGQSAVAQIAVASSSVSATRVKTSSNPLFLTNILPNPSFSTAGGGGADVFGSWAEDATAPSTINRDLAEYDSSPAACRFDIGAGAQYAEIYQLSVLPTGPMYRMTVRAKASNATAGWLFALGPINAPDISFVPGTTWATSPTYEFVKRGDSNLSIRRNGGNSAGASLWIDDVTIDRYNALTTWAYVRPSKTRTATAVGTIQVTSPTIQYTLQHSEQPLVAPIAIQALATGFKYTPVIPVEGSPVLAPIVVQALTARSVLVKTTFAGHYTGGDPEYELPYIEVIGQVGNGQGYTPPQASATVQVQSGVVPATAVRTRSASAQVQVQSLQSTGVRTRNASVHGAIPEIQAPRLVVSAQRAPVVVAKIASSVTTIAVQALQPQPIRVKTVEVLGAHQDGPPWEGGPMHQEWVPIIAIYAKSDATVTIKSAGVLLSSIVVSAPAITATSNSLIKQASVVVAGVSVTALNAQSAKVKAAQASASIVVAAITAQSQKVKNASSTVGSVNVQAVARGLAVVVASTVVAPVQVQALASTATVVAVGTASAQVRVEALTVQGLRVRTGAALATISIVALVPTVSEGILARATGSISITSIARGVAVRTGRATAQVVVNATASAIAVATGQALATIRIEALARAVAAVYAQATGQLQVVALFVPTASQKWRSATGQVSVQSPSITGNKTGVVEIVVSPLRINAPSIVTSSFKVRSAQIGQVAINGSAAALKTKAAQAVVATIVVQQVGTVTLAGVVYARALGTIAVTGTGRGTAVKNASALVAPLTIQGRASVNSLVYASVSGSVAILASGVGSLLKTGRTAGALVLTGNAVVSSLKMRTAYGLVTIVGYANGNEATGAVRVIQSQVRVTGAAFAQKTWRRLVPLSGSHASQQVVLTRISTGKTTGSATPVGVETSQALAGNITGTYVRTDANGDDES